MNKPLILITNDDGIDAPGLKVLEQLAQPLGQTLTVAPSSQMSGVSQSITLHDPVRIEKHGPNRFSVRTGTPTDCVFIAMAHLVPRRPTVVLSGINFGLNVASDVVYSGTVAGAREGVLQGIPGIAISMDSCENWDPTFATPHLQRIIKDHLKNTSAHGAILNVNIPAFSNTPIQGIKTTTLGTRRFENMVEVCTDPRGQEYLWVGGNAARVVAPPGSDCKALEEGFISVTAVAPYGIDPASMASLPEDEWPSS